MRRQSNNNSCLPCFTCFAAGLSLILILGLIGAITTPLIINQSVLRAEPKAIGVYQQFGPLGVINYHQRAIQWYVPEKPFRVALCYVDHAVGLPISAVIDESHRHCYFDFGIP